MKRVLVVISSVVAVITITSCLGVAYLLTTNFAGMRNHNEYILDDSNITFTLPRIWEEVRSDNDELSMTKLSATMNMKVYKKSELEVVRARDFFDTLINDELDAVDSSSLVRDYGESRVKNRIIYSKLYSVEKDGVITQYYFNIMEFVGSETYIYVLYETSESYMKYHMSDINRMLRRMDWNGEEIDLAMN